MNEKIAALLNDQINKEFYSAYLYLDIANHYDELDLDGYAIGGLAVGEATADALAPVQEKFYALLKDKAALEAQMKKGAEEASYYARRTLGKVQKKLGFVQIR